MARARKSNEKLAPKIAGKVLKSRAGLVSFIAKKTYKISRSPAKKIRTFLIIMGKARVRGSKARIPRKPSRIWISSLKHAHKWKNSILAKWQVIKSSFLLKKVLTRRKNIYEEIAWKSEVFLLASRKIIKRGLIQLSKQRLDILKIIKLPLLTLRLKIILITTRLPKPTVSKTPKSRFVTSGFTFFFLLGFGMAFAFWYYILKDLPSPQELTTRPVEVSTKIYDRNGVLLYKIYKDKNRTPVSLDKIPAQVKLATLAIEDAEFYDHIGFSIKGIVRAIIKNIKKGELTGGSTITQQLVKNALLSSEKTLIRKLKEITLAVQVELTYTKDEILEMYLNEVSYGGTAYGIQEASRMYFGKDVDKLTLAEAALLAGIPKSPTQYSPFGANPQKALERQKEVLRLMYANGFITQKQKEEAEAQQITFAQNKIDIKSPHFVMYVKEELEKRYSKELVEKGGLEVTTTLDYSIQQLVEKVIKEEVEKLAHLNVTNAAALVLNPQTGEILAMVGSKDYFDIKNDGNVNVVTSLRQPGSAIKIVNYAYALSNGFTPATIIYDTPTTFFIQGQKPYTPKNYEGEFRGPLTLRSAFAESRNIPAVKVLNSYGVKKMVEMGQKMGITTWENPSNYGLSLTLGGGEVKLIDLARVYATVANYGRRPEITSVLKITNFKGKVLEKYDCPEKIKMQKTETKVADNSDKKNTLIGALQNLEVIANASEAGGVSKIAAITTSSPCGFPQVLDPRVAFILTDILKDNSARAPAFGTNSMLVIPNHQEVAVKTGTSNNLRDNLTIGYNQNYLVAVWVGNNDNSPMSRVASGVTGASPIFNKIMRALLAKEENHNWEVPDGLIQLPICPLTGTLACNGCPVKMEWFLEENKPEIACSPEWFKKDEKTKPAGEQKLEPREGRFEYFLQPTLPVKYKKKRPPILY